LQRDLDNLQLAKEILYDIKQAEQAKQQQQQAAAAAAAAQGTAARAAADAAAAAGTGRMSPPPAGVMPGTPVAAEVLATAERQRRQQLEQLRQQQQAAAAAGDMPAPSPRPTLGELSLLCFALNSGRLLLLYAWERHWTSLLHSSLMFSYAHRQQLEKCSSDLLEETLVEVRALFGSYCC
jgi:hypothetical protein